MAAWKFQHPFTARFVGPTACGKTTFLKTVIEKKLIHPWPTKLFYFYGSSWQSPMFDYLQEAHDVVFIKGLDESILKTNVTNEPSLVILDDLILETKDSSVTANVFMRGSHHQNMSIILIEQTLFPKGRQSVSMKVNTHYTVLFKNPSDSLGVATLARQMFPSSKGRFLIDSFHDCTREPFSYLIIDSKQSTPNHLRLLTNITASCPLVYVSHADKSSEAFTAAVKGSIPS